MAQMVKVRNTGAAAAMVNGALLYEDEIAEVAAGLVAQLQAIYPQLVVIGGEIATDAGAESTTDAQNGDESPINEQEQSESPTDEQEQPKAKAKKK